MTDGKDIWKHVWTYGGETNSVPVYICKYCGHVTDFVGVVDQTNDIEDHLRGAHLFTWKLVAPEGFRDVTRTSEEADRK